MRRVFTGFASGTALAVAGCASVDSEQSLRAHGYSEAYVAGYHDGCPAGEAAAGELFRDARRDDAAYRADGDYKTGWDYGFLTCGDAKRQEMEIARAIGSGIAASSGSSHGADGIDARQMLEGFDTSAIRAAGW